MKPDSAIRRWLAQASPFWLNVYAVTTAFSVYFAMFAFRKPFSAGTYEGLHFFGTRLELKTVLVIGQILGYGASKYLGVKFCSEAARGRRAATLLGLIVCAELAMIAFAVLPNSWKPAAMLANGLPLGMIWGLVVRYLEGRRTSELLLAGLSCSFILASGVMKDLGRALVDGVGLFGVEALRLPGAVPEFWMPAVAGAMFLAPLALAVWLLDQLPEPTAEDVAARSARTPMDREDRRRFVRQFFPGLALLVVAYFALTAFRDFRDNYMVDVLQDLGVADGKGGNPMSRIELAVTMGILPVMGLLFLIRDNRTALAAVFSAMVLGMALIGGSTYAVRSGNLGPYAWMTLLGLGTYLAYVPYNSVLFDRLLATTRAKGTAVFAIYLADSAGYTGSILVQLYRDLFAGDASRLEFLTGFSYAMSAFGAAALVLAGAYFLRGADRGGVGGSGVK